MSDTLFRKQALERHLGGEARGAAVTITPPAGVVVFAVMTLALVALVLLATVGEADVYAGGRGVVASDRPLVVVRAPMSGSILSVALASGATAKKGDLMLALDVTSEQAALPGCTAKLAAQEEESNRVAARMADWSSGGRTDTALAFMLISESRQAREKLAATRESCAKLQHEIDRSRVSLPVDATVNEVLVSAGSPVHVDDPLATLAPSDGHLVGYIQVPEAHRSELVVGRSVRLKFDALPWDAVGVGDGVITRLLDGPPTGVKLEDVDASQAYAEVSIDHMPGSAHPRVGMKFACDVFVAKKRIWSLLFGG